MINLSDANHLSGENFVQFHDEEIDQDAESNANTPRAINRLNATEPLTIVFPSLESPQLSVNQLGSSMLNSVASSNSATQEQRWRTNSMKIANELGIKNFEIPIYRALTSKIGLSKEHAFFIILAHDCQSEGAALELLTSDNNDFFNHYFLPEVGLSFVASCQICGESEALHTLKTTEDLQFSAAIMGRVENAVNDLQEQAELPVHLKECQICLQNLDRNLFLYINGVCHEVCVECFKLHLEDRIVNNKVSVIRCPHCEFIITQNLIQRYVDQRTYNKYNAFLKDYLISEDPLNRWCPNIHCSQMIRLPNEAVTRVTCGNCQTVICGKCSLEDHGSIPCDKVADEQIKQLTETEDIERCKNCKALVEKLSGCNHMTCYQWCWLCGTTYDSVHFAPFNPFGCPAMQSSSFNVHNTGPVKRCVIRLLLVLAMIFALPFALVFGAPVFLSVKFFEKYRRVYAYNKTCLYFSSFLIFCFSFLLDPLVWLVFTVGFVPFIIYIVHHSLEQRARVNQYSENNVRERLGIRNL